MKIIDINIGKQTKALFRKKGGGNEWKKLGKKGEKQVLNKEEILELAKLVKKIEDYYGTPQDIEWAQDKNGKFFITQSRPITTLGSGKGNVKKVFSKNMEPELFKKFMNRSFPLFLYEIWYQGEKEGLPKVCNNTMFFDPIFIYTKNKGTQVLYNITDEMQVPFLLVSYFNGHKDNFKSLTKKYLKNYYKSIKLAQNNYRDKANLQKNYSMLIEMLPVLTAMILIGKSKNKYIDKSIIKNSNSIRRRAENFVGIIIDIMLQAINNLLPRKYKKYSYFLSYDEIVNKKLPSIGELKERQQGYIYYDYQIFLKKDLKNFLKKYNFKILKENVKKNDINKIRGQVAYNGKIRGVVKKIFEVKQMNKIKKGDILVASMTTPDLIVAMKEASAFVTDEGGITCHAAIVAREMKKPCIIGTEVATQVLNDGDLVEVDASKGVVKIIKRNK